MRAGHGRGYYGSAQLDRPRRSGGWFKFAVVVGLGAAAVWLMWPRTPAHEEEPTASPPPPAPSPPPNEELEQLARSRGFPSAQAFEDSVVASARELRATGAKVELAPPLRHLEGRLEPGIS